MADIADDAIHIVGAGPAGLAAALTLARAGRRAVVHEQRPEVGGRFHGDLQGIENWTAPQDVLEELEAMGVDLHFAAQPCYEGVFFDPAGANTYTGRPDRSSISFVEGASRDTLDQQLKAQALSAGVELRFRDPVTRLPQGGIVAGGPRGPDAIAVGYVFETDRADGVFGVLSDALAPKGYSYLLVSRGRGTVAACLFEDFHHERTYLERTLDFFRAKASLEMRNPVRFGGTCNVLLPSTACHGDILFVGEAAGFQDALWGFGMRLAMISGNLAAGALLAGNPSLYDGMWRRRLGATLRTSLINRYCFSRHGRPRLRAAHALDRPIARRPAVAPPPLCADDRQAAPLPRRAARRPLAPSASGLRALRL